MCLKFSQKNFVLLLLLLYIIVSFIQGSHTHIPETNHFPRGYIVTAILSLLFMVPLCLVPALVLLFFYVSIFRSMCAVPNMAVIIIIIIIIIVVIIIVSSHSAFLLGIFTSVLTVIPTALSSRFRLQCFSY